MSGWPWVRVAVGSAEQEEMRELFEEQHREEDYPDACPKCHESPDCCACWPTCPKCGAIQGYHRMWCPEVGGTK